MAEQKVAHQVGLHLNYAGLQEKSIEKSLPLANAINSCFSFSTADCPALPAFSITTNTRIQDYRK
jgi:hypothetical protein